MNLVAKEFVASRVDDDGVLVLSEFAGAASELAEALHVNPYDLDGMAAVMQQAIEMPRSEQRTRMRALRHRVRFNDVSRWMARYLEQLDQPPAPRQLTPRVEVEALVTRLSSAPRLTLLLDYDGTLVPIVGGPALATPDEELLSQLRELAAAPGIDVQLVSGRAVETLEAWLGALPIGLWAEHGLWYRAHQDAAWELTVAAPREWMERVRPLIRQATQATPGSLVEEKTASFAWHYRMADPDLGERHARELRAQVATAVANEPVEVLEGSKVIEIRLRGVSKAIVIPRLAPGTLLVAFGDDRTDEDMFAALPHDGVAIHVGPLSSGAHFRLKDWRAVRQLLHAVAHARAAVPAH
jgi:trehalose 6-phosphate synthase/phosphatase